MQTLALLKRSVYNKNMNGFNIRLLVFVFAYFGFVDIHLRKNFGSLL
jgi:hypothetical protein